LATKNGIRVRNKQKKFFLFSEFSSSVVERDWRGVGAVGEGCVLSDGVFGAPFGVLRLSEGRASDYAECPVGETSKMNTVSKLGSHTQTDRGTCPGVGL
jgi:hypothetical protein